MVGPDDDPCTTGICRALLDASARLPQVMTRLVVGRLAMRSLLQQDPLPAALERLVPRAVWPAVHVDDGLELRRWRAFSGGGALLAEGLWPDPQNCQAAVGSSPS